MIRLSIPTTAAIALHATEQDWIVFLQCQPAMGTWPVRIEGIPGRKLVERLNALETDNPFAVFLVGLVDATGQLKAVEAEYQRVFETAEIHNGWYQPTLELITAINATQASLQELLDKVQTGGIAESLVDINDMAEILGVSVPTVRRLVGNDQIPYLRFGRALRFVPSDVLASLQARKA